MNYQERVSTRADVRALYEKVAADPAIARYRGYTESKSYGWDVAADDYIKREGEIWFENPNYDPAYIPEGIGDGGDADLLDEQLAKCDERIEELEAEKAVLEEEITELECRVAEAEEKAKAAENERDEAKEALMEIHRALVLIAQLAGVK